MTERFRRRGRPKLRAQKRPGARENCLGCVECCAKAIVLGEGLVIEAVDDPTAVSDNVPQSSLIVSARDLDELIDILGPGSRVLVRQ